MNLYDLESFLKVVQKGNFSKAAEALSMTQPALSQRIKQLEEELGYALFTRQKGSRGIELTDAGRGFIDTANQMLALWKGALNVDTEEKQTLSVSIIDSVVQPTLQSIGRRFAQEHPEVQFSMNSYRSSESPKYIEDGNVDLAIVGAVLDVPAGVLKQPLYSEPRVFVCQPNAGYPEIIQPKLLGTDKQLALMCNIEVLDWQEYWFFNSQQTRNSHIQMQKIPYVDPHLLDNGVWAVVPMSVASLLHQTIQAEIHTIQDGPPPRMVYTLQRYDSTNTCAIQKFMRCVYEEIEKVAYLTPLYTK